MNARIEDAPKPPAIAQLESLPVLPMVVARLLALDSESAAMRGCEPVTTLNQAIVRLGARHVSSLVVGLSVARVFVPRGDWERSLWLHAVQVAIGARILAQNGQQPDLRS